MASLSRSQREAVVIVATALAPAAFDGDWRYPHLRRVQRKLRFAALRQAVRFMKIFEEAR